MLGLLLAILTISSFGAIALAIMDFFTSGMKVRDMMCGYRIFIVAIVVLLITVSCFTYVIKTDSDRALERMDIHVTYERVLYVEADAGILRTDQSNFRYRDLDFKNQDINRQKREEIFGKISLDEIKVGDLVEVKSLHGEFYGFLVGLRVVE